MRPSGVAKRHVGGDRRRPGVIGAANRAASEARVMVLLQLVDVSLIRARQQQIDIIIVVAIFRRAVDKPLAQLLAGEAGEVVLQRLCKLLLRHHGLFEHQFAHGSEAVAKIGDAHLQAGNPVIFRAALFNTLAALNAIINQRRAENIVRVLLQHRVHHALDFNRFAGVVADLVVPGVHYLIKAAEVARRERVLLRQKSVAGGGVATAFQRRQHHAGEVNEAHSRAAVAPFAADRRFDAANRRIVIRIFAAHSKLNKLVDDDFIIIKRGHTETAADHLHAGVEEIIAHPGVVAHAQVRLRGTQTTARLQHGPGERVDGIHRLAILQALAANSHVLVKRAARRGFRVRAGANFVDLQQLQPAALQQFNGALTFKRLLQFDIAAIPRIEILVETPEGNGVAVGLNLQH
ncbi:hypothetical protein BN133_1181 [Cronobacter dublinensis 582]|nr:hypothetical protein BN133_1181 [Cronobacter dublinensis 582]